MHLTTTLLLVLASAASSAIWAQQPLSLQEAEARVRGQNRQVLDARAAIQIRKEEAAAARTKRFPVLGTSIEAGPLLNKASVTFPAGSLGTYGATGPLPGRDTKIGIPRQISGYSVSQLSLPLLQQPRIGLAIRSADLEAQSARAQADTITQRAVAQVRSLYFQILALVGARTTLAGQVKVANEVVRLAQSGVQEGTSLPAELAEAESRRTRAQTTAANLESDIENQYEQLNLLLGEPVETRFHLDAHMPLLDSANLQEVRARSVANRPEIREAELREQQAAVAIRSKRLEWLPDVDFKVTHYGFINAGNLAPGHVAIAALSLSWEPWDWGRKSHEAAAAREKAQQTRLAVAQAKAQAAAEAGRAWRDWERAQRDLQAARQEVASSAESLRVATQRFANQTALLRSVLEAQSTWESAGQRAVEASAASGVAWANLQLATGANL
jgi:outer membrane protein